MHLHSLILNSLIMGLLGLTQPPSLNQASSQTPTRVIYAGLNCHPPELQLSCTWVQPSTKRALSFQHLNDSLNKSRLLLRKPLNSPPPPPSWAIQLLFLMQTSNMQSHPSSLSATRAPAIKDTPAPVCFRRPFKLKSKARSLEGAQRQQVWQGRCRINISSRLLEPHTIFSSCASAYSCEQELAMADIW